MASPVSIRSGLKTRLATISGVHCYDVVPDNPVVPAMIVVPETCTYDLSMHRGADEYLFKVLVLVQRATEVQGQNALDAYLASSGSSSVKAALEGDKTLAGAAQDIRVESWQDYGPHEFGATTYLGATVTIRIIATGAT